MIAHYTAGNLCSQGVTLNLLDAAVSPTKSCEPLFTEGCLTAQVVSQEVCLHRDVSNLIMEQILLYRDTRESILTGTDAEAWRHMLPAAREKALQAEMKAESNLHPALYPPSEDGSAILGHYKVLYPGSCLESNRLCEGHTFAGLGSLWLSAERAPG